MLITKSELCELRKSGEKLKEQADLMRLKAEAVMGYADHLASGGNLVPWQFVGEHYSALTSEEKDAIAVVIGEKLDVVTWFSTIKEPTG